MNSDNVIYLTLQKLFFDIKNQLSNISASSLEWLSYVALHAATIPAFVALMTGIANKVPSMDVVLIVWLSLSLAFVRAVVLKNMLNIVTIGLGFLIQAVFLTLIFF